MARAKVLRGYQEELAEPGLRGFNYIICAPTGSGKTLTAASLCRRKMMEAQSKNDEKPFKAIFIVPTRHLKGQQRDAFWDVFPSSSAVAITKTRQFRRTFDLVDVHVLMVTAQILVNALRDGAFRFNELSMLIFDECHHTTLNHPYNEIMRAYMLAKKRLIELHSNRKGAWLVGRPFGGLPQIVGLTASLGTGGLTKAYQHIVSLCANLDCSGVKTVTKSANIRELEDINRPPEQDVTISTPPRETSKVSRCFDRTLVSLMQEIERTQLKRMLPGGRLLVGDPSRPYGSILYQTWIGNIAAKAREDNKHPLSSVATFLLKLNMALQTYEDLPAKYVLQAFDAFQDQSTVELDAEPSRRACGELYEAHVADLRVLAEKENPLSTPKLEELVKLLGKIFTTLPDSRGIVLARTRFATLALRDIIQDGKVFQDRKVFRDGKDPSGWIRPARIVGQGKELEDAQRTREQELALQKFRTGEANVLFATDIVQEGLDVPACNFIIRYNFVSNEIGTVQSMGRARARNSQCYLLVEKGSSNERREQENIRKVEDMAEAIQQVNSTEKGEWLKMVGLKQMAILEEMLGAEPTTTATPVLSAKTSRSPVPTQRSPRTLCRMCRAFSPNGSANKSGAPAVTIHGAGEWARLGAGKRGNEICFSCGKTVT